MYATLIPVESSAIRAVGYDGHTLAVQFNTSDKIYDHPGVPEAVFYGLLNAASKGAYYNQHIRGRYR
ncbi:MAG TPA: KTSC domain-containing protein [Verrucomicrobiae bacterium]|nr:KTSC domain-containing protein [Verrucomicrobiae bacterium]